LDAESWVWFRCLLITADVLKDSVVGWETDIILLFALCKDSMRKICGFRYRMHLTRLVLKRQFLTKLPKSRKLTHQCSKELSQAGDHNRVQRDSD
jgi:hypothetical protein